MRDRLWQPKHQTFVHSQIDGQRKIKLACQIRSSRLLLHEDEGLTRDTAVQEIDLLCRYPTVQHYLSLFMYRSMIDQSPCVDASWLRDEYRSSLSLSLALLDFFHDILTRNLSLHGVRTVNLSPLSVARTEQSLSAFNYAQSLSDLWRPSPIGSRL